MEDVAQGLYDLVVSNSTLQTLTSKSAPIIFEQAEHSEDYPYITFSIVSSTPRIAHSPARALQFSVWDFKVWAENALEVLTIQTELTRIFDIEQLSVDRVGAMMPGRLHPLISELNQANNIIYSQNLECEIFIS